VTSCPFSYPIKFILAVINNAVHGICTMGIGISSHLLRLLRVLVDWWRPIPEVKTNGKLSKDFWAIQICIVSEFPALFHSFFIVYWFGNQLVRK